MSSEPTSESADRLEAAEAFLQEAVYRSRAKQAASFGLAREARAAEGADTVQCGLGREAAIELDLAEKGRALADRIWSAPLDADGLAHVQSAMRAWIRRQDALDRDRNHFLKAFRKANGFDRRAYDAEQLAAYEAGLEAINRGADEERRAFAEHLLDPARPLPAE